MKCKFTNVLMFAVGAAIGSAVTWKIVKDRYEKIVQEEIESIKEAFANNIPDEQKAIPEGDDLDEEEDPSVQGTDEEREYSKLASNYTSEKGGAVNVGTAPYVISPYDFGEIDEYAQIELTYYADGILEDEDRNVIDNVDELIGSDSLYTFGEYEEDAVFVRNERLHADFQILKDYRTYVEARSTSPKQVADE